MCVNSYYTCAPGFKIDEFMFPTLLFDFCALIAQTLMEMCHRTQNGHHKPAARWARTIDWSKPWRQFQDSRAFLAVMCIFTHICTYESLYMWKYMHILAMSTCICVPVISICKCIHTYIYMYTFVCINTLVYVYMYMYVCMYICLYVDLYIHEYI